jgi:hypothetical protein
MRDCLFEVVGRSAGQCLAKLLPLSVAGYVAVQLGDEAGKAVVAVTGALYMLVVMVFGLPVWMIADFEEDGRSARELVTSGRTDYQNLLNWIALSERLLRDGRNPPLPTDHITNLRAAGAAVRARIQRQAITPAPVCSLSP